jgi:hypothetical protein
LGVNDKPVVYDGNQVGLAVAGYVAGSEDTVGVVFYQV